MTVVLDASALLALLLVEPGSDIVRAELPMAEMSTVNLSEVVARLVRDHPEDVVRAAIGRLDLRLRDLDDWLATEAGILARLTHSAGLSLGDRCCLALAKRLRVPALTADRAWVDMADAVGVEVRLIR
jgi:PIN domain nuclease of toxin-antitoxin system